MKHFPEIIPQSEIDKEHKRKARKRTVDDVLGGLVIAAAMLGLLL